MAFFRGSSSELLQLMAMSGPALRDLEAEFRDAYVAQHDEGIQPLICDFFEKRPEKMGKFALGLVSRALDPLHLDATY